MFWGTLLTNDALSKMEATAKLVEGDISEWVSRIDWFSLGPIEEGSKRGRDGSRGAGVLARGTRSCT